MRVDTAVLMGLPLCAAIVIMLCNEAKRILIYIFECILPVVDYCINPDTHIYASE